MNIYTSADVNRIAKPAAIKALALRVRASKDATVVERARVDDIVRFADGWSKGGFYSFNDTAKMCDLILDLSKKY